MEDVLHCNRLECRKVLGSEGQAVVTTCSHIFCVSCANRFFTDKRNCPACEATLDQPDDVVVTSLNPSADYRTSVLAGLAPGIVMEIATRSLSFWQYQCSQEAIFQRLKLKNAQERATTLEAQLRTTISEANNQLGVLQTKVNDLTQELRAEKSATYELREKLRASRKDYERLKSQLDRTMRQSLIPGRAPGSMLSEAAANAIHAPQPVTATGTPARFYPAQPPLARGQTSPAGSSSHSGSKGHLGATHGTAAPAASIWQAQALAQGLGADGLQSKMTSDFEGGSRRTTPQAGPSERFQPAESIMHGRFEARQQAADGQRPLSRAHSRSHTPLPDSDVLHTSRALNGAYVTPKKKSAKPSLNEFFNLDRR